MREFKVGDKVVRIKKSDWPSEYGEVGKEYTVLEVTGDGSIVVIDGQKGAVDSAFKLVSRATPQPDYNDGKWHGWNGGECPVHPESFIEVQAYERSNGKADNYIWSKNTIAFRVITPYAEPTPPKEYTIDPRKNIIWYESADDMVHVREVTQ